MDLSRRRMLELMLASGAGTVVGCTPSRDLDRMASGRTAAPANATGADAILAVEPLTTPWQTHDPFLFCMHHDDRYPPGNAQLKIV